MEQHRRMERRSTKTVNSVDTTPSHFTHPTGKVVIVTGSSRGIGREVARVLLAAGNLVVLNGRDSQRLELTRTDLLAADEALPNEALPNEAAENAAAARIIAVATDVSTEEGARRLVASTISAFGRIDGLINNVGVSMRGPLGDLRPAAIDNLYRTNTLGAILPTIAALPALVESRGKVLFISTVGALWGFPHVSLYSATKAAVASFARSLDAEYRSLGVSSTVVFLGFVENDPDKETLAPDGTRHRYTRKAQLTQPQAARAIVRALTGRRREVVTTVPGRILALATRLAPGLVAFLLARSGNRIHAVRRS